VHGVQSRVGSPSALESRNRHRGRELGREYLHHHLAAEAVLVGDEHLGHASTAQLTLERIAAGKRLLDARAEIRHGGP